MQVFGSYEETILSTYNTYRNQFNSRDAASNLEALNYASISQIESLKMFENVSLIQIAKKNMPEHLKRDSFYF